MIETTKPFRLFVTGTDTGVGKTHVTCLIARQLISRGFRVAAYKPVCSGAISTALDDSARSCSKTGGRGAASSEAPERFSSANPGASEDGAPRPPLLSAIAKASDDGAPQPRLSPQWDDIERLKSATGGDWPDEVICPQRFLAPLAPPIAARREGKVIDFQQLIEGADRFGDIDGLLIEGAGGWLSPLTETQTVADLALALNVPVLIVARTGLGTINHTLLTIESVRARCLTVAGIVLNESCVQDNDDSIRTNPDEIEARSGAPVFGTIPFGSTAELHRNGKPVTIDWRVFM